MWKLYFNFCIYNKQYIENKNVFRKFIQSMIYCDNPITYKNYKLTFNENKVSIINLKKIKNKYLIFKNKILLLLLYQYIKIKRKKKLEKINKYINYMIKIPLHENIIQKIIKKVTNMHDFEYKILCNIIKEKVINENTYYFVNIKRYNNINTYINYNKNKIYDKSEIIEILIEIKKIFFKIQKYINIHIFIIYINHFLKCLFKNTYHDYDFISVKNLINKINS